MGRLVKWTAGVVGIAALARLLRRHRARDGEPVDGLEADPAAELRDRLAASREAPAEPERAPEGAGGDDEGTLEERRARVHAKAQEALDAMNVDDARSAGDP